MLVVKLTSAAIQGALTIWNRHTLKWFYDVLILCSSTPEISHMSEGAFMWLPPTINSSTALTASKPQGLKASILIDSFYAANAQDPLIY